MANEILVHTSGSTVCWADSTQYVPGAYGPGQLFAKTHNLNLKGVADGAARQGDKADLGVKRAQGYVVKAAAEFAVAPTAGNVVEYYWSSSPVSHPSSGNAGGYSILAGVVIPFVSGIDGTFVPAGGAEANVDEWKQHLSLIGVLPVTNDAVGYVQTKVINSYFVPPERYGQPIVKNDTGQAFAAGGSGMYLAFIPVTDELQ